MDINIDDIGQGASGFHAKMEHDATKNAACACHPCVIKALCNGAALVIKVGDEWKPKTTTEGKVECVTGEDIYRLVAKSGSADEAAKLFDVHGWRPLPINLAEGWTCASRYHFASLAEKAAIKKRKADAAKLGSSKKVRAAGGSASEMMPLVNTQGDDDSITE
jgi:hypothetical protein